MLSVARRRSMDAGFPIEFAEGDAHALAFPDRAFDSAVSLRVLMHVPDWRKALTELCRVTERRLVLDYPAAGSTASVHAAWRRAALKMGRRVESYRVFRARAVADQLARCGFRVTASHRQFALPIALHKLVGSARFTQSVEGALAAAGILRLAGSPVTIAAERCAS
jgi:SAM-dependent methyltransferase